MEKNNFSEKVVCLTFEHVSHQYEGLASVRDVSISVIKGEILCLLGHSGCGKTTLLRIAAGVERQSEGVVKINDNVVAGPETFLPPEKRNVGLMFQDYALFPHLSILDNVRFGLSDLSRADSSKLAVEALNRVGLSRYINDYPHVLSGGEQQRVALARALAPSPSVLLMDEPFNGLDKRLRDKVSSDTLKLLRNSGTTCIIVTHDPEEAMQVSDRIALMRLGRIIQIGKPDEIYMNPTSPFAASFFSEINEIQGVVSNGVVKTPFGPIAADGLTEGDEAWIGIRPHDLEVVESDAKNMATVLSSRFLGEVDSVDLQLDGVSKTIRLRLPSRQGESWPRRIGLKLRQDRVLLFNKSHLDA